MKLSLSSIDAFKVEKPIQFRLEHTAVGSLLTVSLPFFVTFLVCNLVATEMKHPYVSSSAAAGVSDQVFDFSAIW